MRTPMLQRLLAGLAWLLMASMSGVAASAPELSALFVDHAVLQRDRPIDVFGRAGAGEEVTVSLGNASATARTDDKGRWNAQLPAQPAGGPFTLNARSGSRSQSASDVLIGDVW